MKRQAHKRVNDSDRSKGKRDIEYITVSNRLVHCIIGSCLEDVEDYKRS